jgi:ubiquinone biosynthesis protein COQ9
MNAAQLTAELRALLERVENVRTECTNLKSSNDATAFEMKAIREELIRVQIRFDEQQKHNDKWDTRRWALLALLIGSMLSLVANLLVILVKR